MGLQALKDPNKCSAPQIMQATTVQFDTLRTQGKLVSFHWIPSHKDIKGNEDADIAAKEATGWRRAKRRNGKWKEWDSGHTAEKQNLGRSRATVKLPRGSGQVLPARYYLPHLTGSTCPGGRRLVNRRPNFSSSAFQSVVIYG